MPKTGADLFIEVLSSYGVTHLFGNPGTTELPIMQSLVSSDIDYTLGLHEDIAMGAAAGYATRRRYHNHSDPDVLPLGVVNLHLIGGLVHGLSNMYNAQVAQVPLLVTAGTHSLDFQHEEPILSGDLVSIADQFAKLSIEVKSVSALPRITRRAVRTALTPPMGPVFISLPVDVQQAETDLQPERLGEIPTLGAGDSGSIETTAEILLEASEPVLILGDEVARTDAVNSAIRFAEAVGARVHGEVLAYEVNFPTDHHQWCGVLPTKAPDIARKLNTDTLIFAGCSTNTTITSPTEPLITESSKCVEISNNGGGLGKHTPADAALIGDIERTLEELTKSVNESLDDSEKERRLQSVQRTKEKNESKLPDAIEGELTKMGLARAIDRTAPNAILISESLTSLPSLLSEYSREPSQLFGTKGGSLGYGLPATLGAAIAERETDNDKSVIGYIGDGSYLYYPQSLYTAARYDLDITIVIPNNRGYRILKENTADLIGGQVDDYEYMGVDFQPQVNFVKNVESHGATGAVVTNPGEVDRILTEALNHDGPTVVDVPVRDEPTN